MEAEVAAIENECGSMEQSIKVSEGELAKAQEDQRILEKQVTKVENILMELRNAMYSELFNRDGYVQSSTSS